jgi:hypothetical protein
LLRVCHKAKCIILHTTLTIEFALASRKSTI